MANRQLIHVRLPHSRMDWLVLALALLTLALAIPRTLASFNALHPETIRQESKLLPDSSYLDAIRESKQAIDWTSDAEYWHTQAQLLLKHLKKPDLNAHEQRDIVEQAIAATENGLRLSPVDPFAWQRLMLLRQALEMDEQQVVSAFKASLYAGRVEPELAMPRIRLGYELQAHLDTEALDMWLKQIPVAYQFSFNELVQWSAKHPDTQMLVQKALATEPEKAALFNKAFELAILSLTVNQPKQH